MVGNVWRALGTLLVLPALAAAGSYAPRLPHDECAGAVPIASLPYGDQVDIESFFSEIDDVNFPCSGYPGRSGRRGTATGLVWRSRSPSTSVPATSRRRSWSQGGRAPIAVRS